MLEFRCQARVVVREDASVKASGVKRICNAPLSAPHRVLGVLSLGRLAPAPFTKDELHRVTQVAQQIAIALENAMAFAEIAALKERLARENVYLQEEIRGTQHFEEIVGPSKALQHILNQVSTVAGTDTTVLLNRNARQRASAVLMNWRPHHSLN